MLQTRNAGLDIVVYISGRLDSHEGSALEIDLNRLVESRPDANLVLELKNVEFISSSGLRVFLSIKRKLNEKKRTLVLCAASEPVEKIISAAGLGNILVLMPDEKSALQSFS